MKSAVSQQTSPQLNTNARGPTNGATATPEDQSRPPSSPGTAGSRPGSTGGGGGGDGGTAGVDQDEAGRCSPQRQTPSIVTEQTDND